MGARGVHAAPLGLCWTAEKDIKMCVCVSTNLTQSSRRRKMVKDPRN